MNIRTIGHPGLQISRIGLGCVTFGREISEEESFRVLDYAFEKGIHLFDTAEGYGGGQVEASRRNLGIPGGVAATTEMSSSEKIIGRWLRSTGLRSRVVLQTKIARDFNRPHLADALEKSLDRLQTDFVDIYLFHSYDAKTPLPEALEAMSAAVRSGRVRLAGCSNFDIQQLRSAQSLIDQHDFVPLQVLQPVYNLVRREVEADVLPFCRAHGIAPVIYSPLGAGFLSGKYRRATPFPAGSRFDMVPGHSDEYYSDRNFETVERLRSLAARTGFTMAQLAMAWVFGKPQIDGVLIGARGPSHIDNAIAAMETTLTADIMTEMDSWSDAE